MSLHEMFEKNNYALHSCTKQGQPDTGLQACLLFGAGYPSAKV